MAPPAPRYASVAGGAIDAHHSPRTPHKTSFQRVCLSCLMDKCTYGMDMMDNLAGCPHAHPYGALAHRGLAYGLTRFACLNTCKLSIQ